MIQHDGYIDKLKLPVVKWVVHFKSTGEEEFVFHLTNNYSMWFRFWTRVFFGAHWQRID